MELSPQIQSSLSLCTSIPVPQFSKLAKQALSAAIGEHEIDADEILLEGVDPAVAKQLFGILVTIALEAAKYGLGEDVSDVFVDHGVDKERSGVFGKVFASHVSQLRSKLRQSGFSHPHVVDVDWRLALEVRSSELDHVSAPNYVISFKLDDGKNIEFVCSADELLDMSGKFADASKQLERFSQQ